MSSFITNSLIKPIAQWYSEINSATLTGAIDVLVIEQDDGSFVSSPFHVRFGKLGVLKAKEKIVDIEINDEPVEIHMKLDDHGAAFFVEDFSETEDEDIPPELATSPIPETSPMKQPSFEPSSSVNRSLAEEFDKVEAEAAAKKSAADDSAKSKLNRKKRKRRHMPRHSRNSSKTSMKEIVTGEGNKDISTSSSSSSICEGKAKSTSEIFDMEEDADNDGDLDDDTDNNTPINSTSTPKRPSHITLPVNDQQQTSSNTPRSESEQSFLQNRLGDETIDSILETQEKINRSYERKVSDPTPPPSSVAFGLGKQYYSEPELTPMTSPQGSRPGTPPQSVLSDTEYENSKEDQKEQSWEWGKLPGATSDSKNEGDKGSDEQNKSSGKDGEKDAKQQKSWSFSFWKSNQAQKKQEVPGIYLDDLKDDEEMMAIYLGSSRHNHSKGSGPSSTTLLPSSIPVDDDAESGKGSSLPMSPHSVDGAIGGPRAKNYDSSDEENKQWIPAKALPDIAFSLCGGISNPDETETFSTLVFEQSLISYDDFVMRLKNNDDIFTNDDLVVRIGDQYYTWQAACPIIMCNLLYGRGLPRDLVKEMKASYQDVRSKEASPNSKARSSWWPFGSTKHQEEHQLHHDMREGSVPKESKEGSVPKELREGSPPKDDKEGSVPPTDVVVDVIANEVKDENKKRLSESNVSGTSSEENAEIEKELKKVEENRKTCKKTLRLSSDAIKQLHLKPGSNEAQFSVTTAYQGTSRCKCHIYCWKSTDKIVISDIDGTITKSDVLGHVLPIIGRDWAQSGVASLFSKIVANGYQIAYLSARAIGQASITKDYLASIRQGDIKLPDGPLFLNPTSLINAFHREVIEKKPEKFKIACLRDIQKLFPEDRNPFYAGYGNRVNDVFAYRAVGIPISRIFTINTKGELRHELTQTFQTSYDCQSSIVDHVFPPLSEVDGAPNAQQEFSSFAYWREPIPQIDLPQLDLPKVKEEKPKVKVDNMPKEEIKKENKSA